MAVLQPFRISKGHFYAARNRVESHKKLQYSNEIDRTDVKARSPPSTFNRSFHQDLSSDIGRVASSMETIFEEISTKTESSLPAPVFAQVDR